MNEKALFGVIGCTLLIGATIIWVIRRGKRDFAREYNDYSQKKTGPINITPDYKIEDNMFDLDAVKMHSTNSIYDRHKAAAQVIQDSAEKTTQNTDLHSEHEIEFDDMLDDLNMLSEKR
jgi:hypothetical protein